jgi:hypothetical protein
MQVCAPFRVFKDLPDLRICPVKAGLFHILLRVLEWSAERCSGSLSLCSPKG